MFKHAFHGGPAVEVLTEKGKNPLEKWKVEGAKIQKVFDKEMKGSIFVMANSSKLQIPGDEKQLLGLMQHFIVF